MIARYDIEQGTYEWHEVRYGQIGGTLAKDILTESDTLTNKLIACRLEDFEHVDDNYVSDDMERGHFLECEANQKIEEEYEIKLNACGWLQSSEFDFIGFSPDGITECETIISEVKCPSREVHTKTIREGVVPYKHTSQITHAFLVNEKLEKVIFASYRPESLVPLFTILITRDSVLNYGTEKTRKEMTVSSRIELVKKMLGSISEIVESEVKRITF